MEKPDLSKVKDHLVIDYINYLEKNLDKYNISSTYKQSYLSLKTIVDKGNEQIATMEIDIMTDDGEKKYKMIQKFVSQLKAYGEQLEYFLSKLNPEEARRLKEMTDKDNLGFAEKMALKNPNGAKN